MTTFDVPNPGFHRISDFKWFGNYVSATFSVDASTPAGSVVVMVKSGNESAALKKPLCKRSIIATLDEVFCEKRNRRAR